MQTTEPALGIFETSFEQHSNELGNYYSINWQWRERKPEEMNQLNLIAEFLNHVALSLSIATYRSP